jgi:hypothetical protein
MVSQGRGAKLMTARIVAVFWMTCAVLSQDALAGTGQRVFRYRDAQGVVQVTGILPPGQAQAGYEILDGRTLRTVKVIDPAPSSAELAAQAAQQRQALRAEAAAKDAHKARQHAAAVRMQRDQMLLQTYASEAELLALRDDKLQTLDLVQGTLTTTVGYLRANLKQMDATVAEHRAAGREPPPELLTARARTAADLAEQEQAAARNEVERAATSSRFADDLLRYRELTQAH